MGSGWNDALAGACLRRAVPVNISGSPTQCVAMGRRRVVGGSERMLPSVDFCGLDVTRLVLGANPFGGFSHQSPERNQEMIAFYTKDRIKETWRRAEAVGINTMVTNNLTAHVLQAVREYLADGGALQWIAQVARPRQFRDTHPASLGYAEAIDEVVNIGCSALYLHGGVGDEAYATRDEEAIRVCCDHARSRGVPVGVAEAVPVRDGVVVRVAVLVPVPVAVLTGVRDGVAVVVPVGVRDARPVGVAVVVPDGVPLGVRVAVLLGVRVGVLVRVAVPVGVVVSVRVVVGVGEGVRLGVAVRDTVGEGVGVDTSVGVDVGNSA